MSGVEIAGLVLGGLPLIIEGLKQYGKGARTIKSMFNYPKEFEDLGRRLRMEDETLKNTLEQLLSDCTDDDNLHGLINNTDAQGWQDMNLETALQRKLGRSYHVFQESIRVMQGAVKDFKVRLRLDDSGKAPFKDSKSFKDAYKAFRFGLKKTAYLDLLRDIENQNNTLRRLIDQTTSLEPIRTVKRRPDFEKVRSYAAGVFDTLQRGLQTTCTASHRASLYVGPEQQDTLRPKFDDITFRVILHHDKAEPTVQLSKWTIEETELKVWNDANDNHSDDQHLQAGTVRFQAKTPSPVASPKVDDGVEEINDLCESISSLRQKKCGICLGYMKDTNENRHELYWPSKRILEQDLVSTTSLAQLLSNTDPKTKLTVGESRKVAAALAYGLLRLYDTPWLGTQLGCKEITFFKKDDTLLAQHPFISTPVLSIGQITPQMNAYFSPSVVIRNELLFALGILLIELCLERPFDELILPSELNADGTRHATSEYSAAQRLVDSVYDRAGLRYGNAVRRCVNCEFDQRKKTLNDRSFRKAVYDGVVAELDADVKQFFGPVLW